MSIRTTLPVAAATAVALLSTAAPALAGHSRDRDHDGMPDRWEHRHHVARARLDPDRDGLANVAEFRAGTDPHRADSDRDGLADGAEVRAGDNPRKRDSDGDGVRDGRENVGAVSSLDSNLLTITLIDGTTVTAIVDDATEIRCDSADAFRQDDAPVARVARHGGEDAGEDQSGTGGDDASGSDDRGTDAAATTDAPQSDDGTGREAEGEDEGSDDSGHRDSHVCPADLTGAIVRKAELAVTPEGMHVEKLELVVRQ
jgi:Bacterial TSP3 repeat